MTDNEALRIAVKMHEDYAALNTKFDLEFVLNKDIWFRTTSDICSNEDGDKQDLFEGEGNTYGWELCWIEYEDTDYLLAKVDNFCGDKYFMLLLKCNEVLEEDNYNE